LRRHHHHIRRRKPGRKRTRRHRLRGDQRTVSMGRIDRNQLRQYIAGHRLVGRRRLGAGAESACRGCRKQCQEKSQPVHRLSLKIKQEVLF
jgi:hypothetical protein